MIKRTLTPTGWLITETADEKEIVNYEGQTVSATELSKKILNTQTEILLVRERVDKLETVFDAVLIAHVKSTDKA